MGTAGDEDGLLAEQRDFYDADAASFDEWLGMLVDEGNDDPVAVRYREGRRRFAADVERRAPLGRVLEIAAGTGRLAELYAPHADAVVLLDSSPRSLELAAARLGGGHPGIRLVEADVFTWDAGGAAFDTIVFTAWLHHVPLARFDEFWAIVADLAALGATVLFDVPDATVTAPGGTDLPEVPSEDYGFFAPVDGVSVRDHFGRRWRVVHHLWHLDELDDRLRRTGWRLTVLDGGLFANVRWCCVARVGRAG